jgi:hypothetical protein
LLNFALVEALKKKGASGEVSEETPIPEGISDEVKKKLSKPLTFRILLPMNLGIP